MVVVVNCRCGLSFVDFLGAFDIIAPQSGQNLASVLTECGGIWYFRDSDDAPHVLQNRSSLSIVVLYAMDLHMGPMLLQQ